MNEAVGNVWGREKDDGTLRGRRACAHFPCQDRGGDNATPGAAVPPVAPGDFTVLLGAVMAGETLRGLEEEMAALGGAEVATVGLLSWLDWIEVEVKELEELVENLRRLRGVVMSVGASTIGRW